MVIGIDVSPISGDSEHKVRGVGKYITLLKENIEKFDKDNQYLFLHNPKSIDKKIDLLHIPYFDPFFIHLPLKKKYKTIITIHDLIPIDHRKHFPAGIKGNLNWQINKRLVSKTDAIIVDSDATAFKVSKILKIDRKRIKTVYLTSDEQLVNLPQSKAKTILSKFSLPEEYFLYVGDVTWNKNLPRLIEAIIEVGIPLVLVGKALKNEDFDRRNPWNKDWVWVNKKTQNDKRFIKLGFVGMEELSALYSNSLALCMPSLDEGFGLPVLEAMKCECPVITSREGSLPEVAGDAAFYVDANDTKSIEKSLREIPTNKKLRLNLISKGNIQAAKFSLRKMMEDTVKIYNSV